MRIGHGFQNILATAFVMLMPHAGNMEDELNFLHEVEDMDVELILFTNPCPFTNFFLSLSSIWVYTLDRESRSSIRLT